MARTYIHNGTLLDGHGGSPIRDAAVVIEDDRIRAAGPAAQVARPGGEVTDLDAHGGFILPGLLDTHVHLMVEHPNFQAMLNLPPSLAYYQAIPSMRRTLDAGITTVRDAGGADLGVKMAVERGLVAGPRMQISITILTITGGHADFTTRSGVSLVPAASTFNTCCDGPDEVRKKVREVLRAGADVIKLCSTGGVLSPTDHPDFTQFTPEELAVAVQEGRYRRGVPVMAHAQGTEGIKNAIRAGVRSIEHGVFLDDEAVDLMVKHGTFLVPTLVAPIGVLEVAERMGLPEYAIRKAREANEAHVVSIAKAWKAGVKIAMGTDAGVIPHGTNLRELGLMCDVGLSPMAAITATTKTAAECLGWQDQIGTVEAGKLADIVISRTDPIANIRSLENTANIAVVLKGGQVVKDLFAQDAPRAAAPASDRTPALVPGV
ncbi:MAG TPA: amidohydrolase family protein [Vicinamibacterales bacterium]|nr:amidohydrolase family protein [Vicinamibacterales bacterium]